MPQGLDTTASSPSTAPPTTQIQERLRAAILTATVESGVVEAACKAAVGALEQGEGGKQQQKGAACVAGGDREALVMQLLELPHQWLTPSPLATAGMLHEGPLRSIFMGPCVQVRGAGQRMMQASTYVLLYIHLSKTRRCRTLT